MQDMEAPTERRVLIGCLETTASGGGISMHEICRQREKEKENSERDHSNITKSLGNCLPHFDFHHPCCPYMNLKLTKLSLKHGEPCWTSSLWIWIKSFVAYLSAISAAFHYFASKSFTFCLSEYPCSGMLGMVSGLITDNQITASSHTDRSWVPENARLLTSRTGWTLLPQPQPFTSEWLQVDLGEEKLVKGLIIQGGKHRENKVFMKKFRLGYSNNGSDWRMVLDTNGNKPKVRVFLCMSFVDHVTIPLKNA